MTLRKLAVVAAAVVALGMFAGCNGSSSKDSSSGSTISSSTTAPKRASAWVDTWKATLISDYGPAQQAFLAAIQSARVVDVQAAVEKVATANEKLSTAIVNAGPPPGSDATATRKLLRGLSMEFSLIGEMARTCTGSNKGCQVAVTKYAENNSKQIVPAFTALGATN